MFLNYSKLHYLRSVEIGRGVVELVYSEPLSCIKCLIIKTK